MVEKDDPGQFIDVSVGLRSDLPVWPGEPPVEIRRTSSLDAGDVLTVSHLSCGVHSGTHLDAPAHFLPGGRTVEHLSLKVLNGPAVVEEVPVEGTAISSGDLADLDLPPSTTRLLLKTPNSNLWSEAPTTFVDDYAALTPDASEWLVQRGIQLVGVDYLSVERYSEPDHATHTILLNAGVVIVEGLNLSNVVPGKYELLCLPLKIMGAEAAPARAVLRTLNS